MSDEAVPQAPPINVELRVEQFIKLRDMKAELKEKHAGEMAPIDQTMDMIKAELKQAMLQQNAAGMQTKAGTISLTSKASASAADLSAFWTWVVTQGAFDMLDKKPNVTAITEYVKQHGVPPPGVNYSVFQDVGVRRK